MATTQQNISGKAFIKKGLTPKSENISEWYNDVVVLADLADYSDVKGSMIIKPHGYAIWEKVQQWLDAKFKEGDVQNVYFPMFIPMSLLEKEKDHLEGFSPELAVVTHAGGEELKEPYAVRPTSETIMYDTFSKWIHSYRDLPLLVNQWCNVVRWEKRTHPFLRTSEFLWQEGHTVHATAEEAEIQTLKALEWYRTFFEEVFAISPYVGVKSESEKFAGADKTYTIELVMPDGKALQSATSHNLGQNFSKVFNIEFLDDTNTKQNPYQTSWGLSTRSIGGLILAHGDDAGLVLPPNAAPIQVAVVVLEDKDETKQKAIVDFAEDVVAKLKGAGIRAKLDAKFNESFGSRLNKWELKGIPLRFEVGGKEVEAKQVKWARRDVSEKGFLSVADIAEEIPKVLTYIQSELLKKSEASKKELTKEAGNFDDFKRILTEDRSFIRAFWCEEAQCEADIKQATKATTRCLEIENVHMKENGVCVHCGKPAHRKWLFGASY
jgi:prolyl-tRNA synthetase